MDGSLFRVLQAQLKFGTLLHKSALSPYLSDQTVSQNLFSLSVEHEKCDSTFRENVILMYLFLVKVIP